MESSSPPGLQNESRLVWIPWCDHDTSQKRSRDIIQCWITCPALCKVPGSVLSYPPSQINEQITTIGEKTAGKEGMRPKAGQRIQTSRGPDKAGYEVGQRQDVGLLRPIIGQSNSLTFRKPVALCSSVCAPQRPGGRKPDGSSLSPYPRLQPAHGPRFSSRALPPTQP